ncbi:hypothetical protein KKH59_02870 [Patescibacteria group bacterium]|nr:hypothetical protein [Patescibacteria group bacterium]
MKFEKLSKKSLLYLGIVIFVALLCLGLIWRFSQMPESKKEIPLPLPAKPSQKQIIQKQLEELEVLRNESATLTEKEIQAQLKELNTLQKKTKPLSEEEIQKQLEELNQLRSAQ